jgi:hypothetical protein
VEEVRLETIVPITGVNAVLGALRQSHPYEEPAYDLRASKNSLTNYEADASKSSRSRES